MLNPLERRIIELSYHFKLSHISSCLNTVNVLDEIYATREETDPVVLGNSHAALALYVVLEANGLCDGGDMVKKHGVHASRDMEHGIWVSGGSLGQAETIAVGMAIAWPDRTVYLVTSDGACAEGSVWEAFRVAAKMNRRNLRIYIVFNGAGAYGSIELDDLPKMPSWAELVSVDQSRYPEWLRGLAGHYLVLNDSQFKEICNEE